MSQQPESDQTDIDIAVDQELLVESSTQKSAKLLKQALGWGKLGAIIGNDIGQSILGFIPQGLGLTYDSIFKRLPILGQLFSKSWVESTLKMLLGVTIGKGLAQDLGYYVFRPLGFIVGAAIGSSVCYKKPANFNYQGQIGHYINDVSGQTIAGALLGLCILLVGAQFHSALNMETLGFFEISMALGVGALIGFMAKTMMLLAFEAVTRANAASARLNTKRAKMLGARLKIETKAQSEDIIKKHATSMILQMNGGQSECTLAQFFADNFKAIVEGPYKKIDRHLNYLTDRAVHGDLESLKRLYRLYRRSPQERQQKISEMLDRVINKPQDVEKLKDEVDSLFDKWKYRELRNGEPLIYGG